MSQERLVKVLLENHRSRLEPLLRSPARGAAWRAQVLDVLCTADVAAELIGADDRAVGWRLPGGDAASVDNVRTPYDLLLSEPGAWLARLDAGEALAGHFVRWRLGLGETPGRRLGRKAWHLVREALAIAPTPALIARPGSALSADERGLLDGALRSVSPSLAGPWARLALSPDWASYDPTEGLVRQLACLVLKRIATRANGRVNTWIRRQELRRRIAAGMTPAGLEAGTTGSAPTAVVEKLRWVIDDLARGQAFTEYQADIVRTRYLCLLTPEESVLALRADRSGLTLSALRKSEHDLIGCLEDEVFAPADRLAFAESVLGLATAGDAESRRRFGLCGAELAEHVAGCRRALQARLGLA